MQTTEKGAALSNSHYSCKGAVMLQHSIQFCMFAPSAFPVVPHILMILFRSNSWMVFFSYTRNKLSMVYDLYVCHNHVKNWNFDINVVVGHLGILLTLSPRMNNPLVTIPSIPDDNISCRHHYHRLWVRPNPFSSNNNIDNNIYM